MSGRLRQLIRPHLTEVEPYTTARSRYRDGTLLDANENALGPLSPEADPEIHRYPDPSNRLLRSALADRHGVPAEHIWVGNGSDEAIDILVRTVVPPGGRVVVAVPTYGVYAARAAVQDAEVAEVRLDRDYDLDVDRTVRAAEGAPLVFLCSPNNPTGNLLDRSRILEVVERTRSLVVVDEAYVEFADRPSLASRAGVVPRLVVLRTFSKAWGLAGARVGWLAAHPVLVRHLGRTGLPYSLSRPAARAARRALRHADEMERRVRRLRRERRRLRHGLEALGLTVPPSDANFLLFFVADPAGVQRRLAEDHGIVIRDRSDLSGLGGALRVTVGAQEENGRFLAALEEVLAR